MLDTQATCVSVSVNNATVLDLKSLTNVAKELILLNYEFFEKLNFVIEFCLSNACIFAIKNMRVFCLPFFKNKPV